MSTATVLPRRFKYEHMVLEDVDPDATPAEIRDFYGEQNPALIGAQVTGPVLKEDAIEYTFLAKYGVKGAGKKKGTDFALMAEVSSILRGESSEGQDEAAPSEALGAV